MKKFLLLAGLALSLSIYASIPNKDARASSSVLSASECVHSEMSSEDLQLLQDIYRKPDTVSGAEKGTLFNDMIGLFRECDKPLTDKRVSEASNGNPSGVSSLIACVAAVDAAKQYGVAVNQEYCQ